MRITIGGEDDVAFRLAEALMKDHEVTVLVPESVSESSLDRLDVRVVQGSCTSHDVLEGAQVENADLYVACTPVDERNLISCAEAKRLGTKEVTCFLRSHAVQSNESEAASLASSLGIDRVILPAERLAREILRIVMVPGALEADAFAHGRVRLVKRAVEEGAHITRGPLKDVGIPRGVVLVMAQRPDEDSFLPNGETHLQPGDKITAMGNLSGINRLLTRFLVDRSRGADPRRATIVGGGVVGFAVARGLERAGWTVKVIESDEERALEIAPQLKSLVLHGDGTDLELLREERIADDPVLIAVTSNDEKNLLVSLLAKQQGVARIVTRADKAANETLFESVGIDVVRSALGAAISAVVRSVNRSDRDLMAEFEHGDVKIVRLRVPDDLPPTEIQELKAPVYAIIGAVLREGRVIIPHGGDTVQGGDSLLVFCTSEGVDETRRFFEQYSGAGDSE